MSTVKANFHNTVAAALIWREVIRGVERDPGKCFFIERDFERLIPPDGEGAGRYRGS